jgi:hypothetical protein
MDQADADGIGIGGLSVPESSTPPPPNRSAFDSVAAARAGDGVFDGRPGVIIMRATLHPLAPGTY